MRASSLTRAPKSSLVIPSEVPRLCISHAKRGVRNAERDLSSGAKDSQGRLRYNVRLFWGVYSG